MEMNVYQFALVPLWALAIVVAAAAAILVVAAIHLFNHLRFLARNRKRSQKASVRREQGRKMIQLALEHGPLLAQNDDAFTIGICPYREYREQYEREKKFRRNVYAEGVGLNTKLTPAVALTSRIIVRVQPTYTFFLKDKYETLMHTGGKCELNRLAEAVVTAATGIRRKEVDEKDFNEAVLILIKRVGNLFVPFAGTRTSIQMSLREGYANHTFDEATAMAMNEVSRSHRTISSTK